MCRDGENRLYCVGANLNERLAVFVAFDAKKVFDKTWIEDEGMFTEHEPKGVSNGNKR